MVEPGNDSQAASGGVSASRSGVRASLSRDLARATTALLNAATHSSTMPDLRQALQQSLRCVASAFDASAVRVFEYRQVDGDERLVQRFFWSRGDAPVNGAGPVPVDSGSSSDTGGAETSQSDGGAPLTLKLPIVVDGATWGKLLLRIDDPEKRWSREEVELLEEVAGNVGTVLARLPDAQTDADAAGSKPVDAEADEVEEAATHADPGQSLPSLDLQRRVRAERALVEASKLLVSTGTCDFDRLLEIVGEATGARYAYLVVITPSDVVSYPDEDTPAYDRDQPIELDTYTQYEWFSSNDASRAVASSAEDAGPTFAVPILSSDDQLFGYVGIEYETSAAPCRDEDARILSVLGDMLCSYLQRQISEEALRRSEQRYRYFVDTISEAIWRVDLATPISTDRPAGEQVQALLDEGIIAECNAAMARLFGLDRPKQIVGRNIRRLTEITGVQFVRDLVDAEYRLRQHEYVVQAGSERERHFVVNTVGVKQDGQLQAVWGSSTEVTERVELERRMVAALERQQQRIGRDLHDRVGQQLAGTRMLAQNLADRHFPEEGQPGRKMIDRIVSYVHEATQHVNDLQRGVMPVQVERDGLAQALVELASRTDMLAEVSCIYTHDGETDVLHHETKLQLYRIAQEATRNALLHGNPSRVDVELYSEGDEVVVCVSDDGVGFEGPDSQPKDASFGLHSMRYRARSIGATLTIDTAPGEGTIVVCRVPKSRLEDV